MAKVGRPKGSGEYDYKFIFYMRREMKLKLDEKAAEFEVSTAELIRKSLEKVIQYA